MTGVDVSVGASEHDGGPPPEGDPTTVAAERDCVSVRMLMYRMAMKGVDRQFGRSRTRRTS